MRLTIRVLGLELLDVDLTTDALEGPGEVDNYDPATVLSGGNLGAYPIDSGPTDRYMGFTLGLGDGDE